MLYLKQGETTVIYSNLLDRVSTTTGFSWLINMTCDFTKESYTCLQTPGDSAIFIDTTNTLMVKYPIKVLTTGSAQGDLQELLLKNPGYYTYDIYYQTGTTNLDITDSVVKYIVQKGKAYIYNNTPLESYTEAKDGSPNNFIYINN